MKLEIESRINLLAPVLRGLTRDRSTAFKAYTEAMAAREEGLARKAAWPSEFDVADGYHLNLATSTASRYLALVAELDDRIENLLKEYRA
jgi:hypothetical protein